MCSNHSATGRDCSNSAGLPNSRNRRGDAWHKWPRASVSHSTSLAFSSKSRSSKPMTSFWRSASASPIRRAPNRRAVDQTLATTIRL